MCMKSYAKNTMAPVGPKAEIMRGKATVSTPAQNRFTATARLIPTSIPWVSGVDILGTDGPNLDGKGEMLPRNT